MLRRLRSRPSVIHPDLAYLNCSQVSKLLGYSRYYFFKHILPSWDIYHLSRPLLLGPRIPRDLRWRADELYALRPDLSPYPKDSTFLARFKDRAAVDRDAYIAQRETERSAKRGAVAA